MGITNAVGLPPAPTYLITRTLRWTLGWAGDRGGISPSVAWMRNEMK